MKIAVIQFPGSNCERETMLAVKRAGMTPVEFLWNASRDTLREIDGYVIVGGFSYEDRSRAGIIAALDPVMQALKEESEKGKPIFGICNGAQILVETGLVPGLENNKVAMALTENKRIANNKILGTGYYNAWINMRLSDSYQRNAYTRHLTPNDILRVPVAHAQGRFVMPEALLREIQMHGLNVFQYCNESGVVEDHFPVNPNGSIDNIAAISNKNGNVLAMMPHPERTSAGDALFRSMRDYLQNGVKVQTSEPLNFYPRRPVRTAYRKRNGAEAYCVSLIITDNQAMTVQNTLRQMGMPVTVERQTYWEVECENAADIETIKQSGVLFNDRKEKIVTHQYKPGKHFSCLVMPKEDLIGQAKKQALEDHFDVKNIKIIRHGSLWHFKSETGNIEALKEQVYSTNIIGNPNAYECYDYHT